MQLSSANRQRFEKDFDKLDAATIQLLRGSAISFSADGFNASGVIFTFDDNTNETFILTAKHNLRLGQPYDPKKTPAPSRLVDNFTKKIIVRYGATDFTQKPTKSTDLDKAPNNGGNAIIFGDGTQDNWDYDVMMVKSTNAGLLAQARNCAIVKTPQQLSALSIQLAAPGLSLKRLNMRAYIQAGFGYTSDKKEVNDKYVGKFQVRYTQPTASAFAAEAYDYDLDTKYDQHYVEVAQTDADNYNSTAPGDSGGPLFSVETPKSGPRVVTLLGVTLGSNQALTEKTYLPEPPIKVNSSSYIRMFLCLAYPELEGCL